jgi:glucose/arabinose dehydrogenase
METGTGRRRLALQNRGIVDVRDGYLYVSVGEREHRSLVQDLGSHVGKVLRIHTDGRVPADNPCVGRGGARPEIWTYGHRNPQGLAFDSSGGLWANEHGPRHGDELNRIEAGRDYGWPRVSFGWEYTGGAVGSGFTTDSQAARPLWVWTPAIAPSDLLIYSGRAFPGWRANFLSTSLNNLRHLNRLVWGEDRFVNEQRLFANQLGRLRSIAQSVEGWLYLGNDEGQILRLRPAGP